MHSAKKRRLLAEINVIPYVDVMLVLLVIFMVTAPFMIQGINVDLPEVDSQPIQKAASDNVTISLNSNGDFFLEFESFKNKSLSLDLLEEELRKIISNNSSIEIYLRADKEVLFGEVAKLMSRLQKLKPGAINFITEPLEND